MRLLRAYGAPANDALRDVLTIGLEQLHGTPRRVAVACGAEMAPNRRRHRILGADMSTDPIETMDGGPAAGGTPA